MKYYSRLQLNYMYIYKYDILDENPFKLKPSFVLNFKSKIPLLSDTNKLYILSNLLLHQWLFGQKLVLQNICRHDIINNNHLRITTRKHNFWSFWELYLHSFSYNLNLEWLLRWKSKHNFWSFSFESLEDSFLIPKLKKTFSPFSYTRFFHHAIFVYF